MDRPVAATVSVHWPSGDIAVGDNLAANCARFPNGSGNGEEVLIGVRNSRPIKCRGPVPLW